MEHGAPRRVELLDRPWRRGCASGRVGDNLVCWPHGRLGDEDSATAARPFVKQFGSTGVEDVGWIGWHGGGTRRLVSPPNHYCVRVLGEEERQVARGRLSAKGRAIVRGSCWRGGCTNRIFEIDDAARFVPRSIQPGRRLQWSVGILDRTFPVGQVL